MFKINIANYPFEASTSVNDVYKDYILIAAAPGEGFDRKVDIHSNLSIDEQVLLIGPYIEAVTGFYEALAKR